MLSRFPVALRPLAAVLMVVCWPVQSLIDARRMARHANYDARKGLAGAAWRAALRHNVPPLEFLAYRMAERPDVPIDAWLLRYEMTRLNDALADPAVAALASDKQSFRQFCDQHDLPGVPTLAVTGSEQGPPPDHDDLIVKPRRGANAAGIEHWRRTPGGYRRLHPEPLQGAPLDWPGLLRNASQRQGPRHGALIQPLLALHPGLRDVIPTGSPAARVVTGRWADGRVEPLQGSFYRPFPGQLVSNGGARRAIDLATGRLLPPEPGSHRPAFGSADLAEDLDGVVLPDWERARALVLKAHAALPGRAALVGWDVAFTPEGPVLIEANLGISCYLEQADKLEPAGTWRLAEVLASWLDSGEADGP